MPEDKGCNSESSHMIKVSSYLTKTMKEWAEATIRTQPSDLCGWSALYFRMKANGERPPVKPYLDIRDLELGPGGLTASILKALATSLSSEFETSEKIENMWSILSLDKSVYFEIIDAGNFKANIIKPIEFIGIAAAFLNTRLRDTMILLCDTLSDEYSIGISLDTFVTVYTYLARLSGTYIVSSKRLARKEDDRVDNVDVLLSGDSDSECFKSSDSEEDSDVDDEPGAADCSAASGWSDAVTKSDEGIMKYRNDNRYAADPSQDLDGPTAIKPPTNTCEDPDQLFAFREIKPNTYDDELRSLLSCSSIISDHDQSVISFGWSDGDVAMTGTAAATDQQDSAEQLHGGDEGETMSGSFAVPEDLCGDDEYDPTGLHSGDSSSAAASNDRNDDMGAEVHDYGAVPVNTDYIVMLALVDGPQPGPQSRPEPPSVVTREDDNGSEHDEPSLAENESAESVFSLLLEHSSLLAEHAAAADDTGDQPRGQTFDETDHYTAVDCRDSSSGNGEPSSDATQEFQYSEIDQQSVESGPPPDVWSTVDDAVAVADTATKDDAACLPHDEDNGYEQFDMDGFDETERNDEFACAECETHSYGQNVSLESAEERVDVDRAGETLEPQVLRVVKTLPGVGPPLPDHQIQRVIDWLTKCARIQNNHVLVRNLLHYLCPPLDHHHHHDYALGTSDK